MAERDVNPDLITAVLFGAPDGMHYTQDTPVLRDVWLAFAKQTRQPSDLLIVPWADFQASQLALKLHERVNELRDDVGESDEREPAEIADMPGVVAAKLYFDELCNIVLPATDWWRSSNLCRFASLPVKDQTEHIKKWTEKIRASFDTPIGDDLSTELGQHDKKGEAPPIIDDATCRLAVVMGLIASGRKTMIKASDLVPGSIARGWRQLFRHMPDRARQPDDDDDGENLIFTINANRAVKSSVANSVPTTKADAAKRVFQIDCSKISWAVVDSGIDSRHDAFVIEDETKTRDQWKSRVKEAYDFAFFRQVRSRDILLTDRRDKLLEDLVDKTGIDPEEASNYLASLAADALKGREADFEKIRELLRLRKPVDPKGQHGTHVAGILGGKEMTHAGRSYQGMCPDISLYDFRVLSGTMQDTEFAVIGALRMIHHINKINNYRTIHGANLSLSLPHDVMNYACGRTPICTESEMLVKNGVVVVAAAGNQGYHEFSTANGPVKLYADTSITDPGNAELVITVGSTHRLEPHAYGVSYFSSRGPTGDGRMKPDLVAPGEKIRAAIPSSGRKTGPLGRKGGTSMAAPHVSGAAAMLMGRFPEFIGEPGRIKQILCQSATDLGRDRHHQGAGLLDILRALQSV